MGIRAEFSRELGIKVESGEQLGISFRRTIKSNYGIREILEIIFGKGEHRPSGGLIAVFSCFACGGDVEWLFE